uniref:Mitochondrial GTPase 1 n=1 Tax=Albugo laibachii Nc14 TaxID=890382 RepID=F0W0F1_9STRA|nr:GTPase putative [Albugo laibachii Nc14]|eukprot:CCA14523.1 GTPase putative [Albugo laibachii Nc14]
MRSVFTLNKKINWFPGHMAAAKKQMQAQLDSVDVLIEVRDARIPFTSANPILDTAFNHSKPRLVVFNKCDLANSNMRRLVETQFMQDGERTIENSFPRACMFTSVLKGKKVNSILQWCDENTRAQFKNTAGTMVMVLGIPNVGKSSLINAFRSLSSSAKLAKGKKRALVGPTPGVTIRKDIIQVNATPAIYVVDTPGVMLPNVENQETGLKLALTGAIRDDIVGKEVLADYMLFLLNRMKSTRYVDALQLDQPTDEIEVLFKKIQRQCGAVGKDPETQDRLAAECLLAAFRRGEFGHFTLDHVSRL